MKKTLNWIENANLAVLPILLFSFIFQNSVSLEFAKYDDEWMLINQNLIKNDLNYEFFKNIFTEVNNLQYSPLNTLYYGLIYRINSLDPYWYHIGSIVIHFLNTFLVYNFLIKVLKRFKFQAIYEIAYLIALLWCVHPLNVEAIVWISASKIPLFSLFYLISSLFFIDFLTKKNNKSLYYILSLLMFVLSFFCKEQAVCLSLTHLLISIFFIPDSKRSIRRLFIINFPFILLSIILGIITLYVNTYDGGKHPFEEYSWNHRFFYFFYSIGIYVINVFLPLNLKYVNKFPNLPNESIPLFLYVIPITITTSFYCLFKILKSNKYSKLYLFLSAFFIFNLILVLHIFSLSRAYIVSDRYMYLPLIAGLSFIVIIIYDFINSSYSSKNWSTYILFLIIIYTSFLVYTSYNLVNLWEGRQL